MHINLKNNNKIFYWPLIQTKTEYLNKENNKLNDQKYENVYESSYIISNIKGIVNYWIYINYKNNLGIKDLHIIYTKYRDKIESNDGYPNNLLNFKPEYVNEYFMELEDIINKIYKEWNMKDPYNIFDNREVYHELEKHLKNKCIE